MTEADNAPLSIEQAVAELGKTPAPVKAEKQTKPEAEPEREGDPEPEPDAENAQGEGDDAELEAEAEADGEELEAEAEPEPIPDPPQSWSKEDREEWANLTPKAREVVLKREADRDKAIAGFAQKTTEAVKAIQALAARTEEISYLAEDAFEKRWQEKTKGPIQWAQLARQMEPAEYQALRAEYETEKADRDDAAKRATEQSELAHRTFLAEEGQKLTTIEPELADPVKGQERRKATFAHLQERGFPPELFAHISALELSVGYDAMRFRESQKAAKAAAAMPRKNVAAPTPKPIRPGAGSDHSPNRTLQGAMTALAKSGTVDNAIAALQAQRAANAKKGARP